MEERRLDKYDIHQLQRIGNSIRITDKLIHISNSRLIPYRKGDKWGYCTFDKIIIIACIYEFAREFSSGVAIVRLNSKYGIINESGQNITEFKFSEFWDFSEGLAVVKFNRKCGFIDASGNIVIPLLFDNANSFKHGKAKVFLNSKSCFVDKLGNIISEWIEDLTYARHGNIQSTYHLFDGDIFLFFEEPSDITYDLNDCMYLIEKHGKYGLKNNLDIEVVPCKYDFIHPFIFEIAMVNLNKKLGYINKFGVEYWED